MQSLTETRQAWHAVGELVLAGPQYRTSGTIRLRVVPGGFATVAAPDLRVEDDHLVAGGTRRAVSGRSGAEPAVKRPDPGETRLPLDGATPAGLAAAVGVPAGAPEGLYHGGSGAAADGALAVDPAAAGTLAEAFRRGDAALREFAPAEVPVLWPEHFDVAITLDEVNYGVSPGDGYLGVPYAYVGPWRPRDGQFWNAPFGAARPLEEVPDLVAFFAAGRDAAAAG
jgi:hypothetical protein